MPRQHQRAIERGLPAGGPLSPFHTLRGSAPACALLLLVLAGGCAASRCEHATAAGNLGVAVNGPYDDYAPSLPDSAMLVFTSNSPTAERRGLQELLREDRPARLLFTMRLGEEWDAASIYRFFELGDRPGIATVSFGHGGGDPVAVASICGDDTPEGGCDLLAVVRRGGGGAVSPGDGVNTGSWEGHPFLTADGERLYFASDRPGGAGGSDIWIADRIGEGLFGNVRNAGPGINTPADELSPMVDEATGDIYFAAATDASRFDLMVVRSGREMREPLPPPINGSADEITPFLSGDRLYFASNRDGGCGGFDLYAFPLPR